MDDDDFGALLFLGALICFAIGFPIILGLSITSCVACSRTKQWKRDKLRRANTNNPTNEAEPLVESHDDGFDSDDSEDEADVEAKKKEEDWHLTTRQKFWKEFKNSWTANNAKDAAKAKEREDRKTLAKAVAKELARIEARRERRANRAALAGSSAEQDTLPTYNTAVANDLKH